MEITQEEYNQLKECRLMLGQISVYVEDFCNEEDTTLMGVIRLLAKYHEIQSTFLYNNLDKLREEQDANDI